MLRRLSDDGRDGTLKIIADVSYWEEAKLLRDTFEIPIYRPPIYRPIPTLVNDEALLRASVTIEGDGEADWRPLLAVQNILEGRFNLIAKLLKRPDTVDRRQKDGKTLAMSLLATRLRGFFCAGVIQIMHADVKPDTTRNWGALTLHVCQKRRNSNRLR